jgi:fucose 4-O-acetylase-like acetyltransferase
MKKRIIWIDWAKALAVCSVVFCHLPQSQEWFYYRYLQALTMVIFFFISGYLKKDHGSDKANWQKYWHSLILPYFFYNAIVYPYWLVKFYMLNGGTPDLFQAMRPILGALLMEHENAFCEPLNGPLWYLPTILIMHIIIDLCKKTRFLHWIMISLCIVSFFIYAANKYWYFAPNLTPMGLMRNIPYYYLGYVFGQNHLFKDCNPKHDYIGCFLCLTISIMLFAWHLEAFYLDQHLLHIILFYPSNIGFLFGVFYGCKLFNNCRSQAIFNLSIGTLAVIGLHVPFISLANLIIEKLFNTKNDIIYTWYDAIPVTILIVILLYPVILYGKKYSPWILGRQHFQTNSAKTA